MLLEPVHRVDHDPTRQRRELLGDGPHRDGPDREDDQVRALDRGCGLLRDRLGDQRKRGLRLDALRVPDAEDHRVPDCRERLAEPSADTARPEDRDVHGRLPLD